MTTEQDIAGLEHLEAFLAPIMMAAMLALAAPLLSRPVQGKGDQEPVAVLFTPEQAAELVKALQNLAIDSGTVTSPAAASSLGVLDASKDWPTGQHRRRLLRVTDGAGFTQARVIQDNSGSALMAGTPWARPLDTSMAYVILNS